MMSQMGTVCHKEQTTDVPYRSIAIYDRSNSLHTL
jgi:hypothetical protein